MGIFVALVPHNSGRTLGFFINSLRGKTANYFSGSGKFQEGLGNFSAWFREAYCGADKALGGAFKVLAFFGSCYSAISANQRSP
jgi:hypothetical protein